MEGHCSTGQSPQWAVVPMEEEEEEEEEAGQGHAPAALPSGKDPIPTVQMYESPDINIIAYNTITLQATEK